MNESESLWEPNGIMKKVHVCPKYAGLGFRHCMCTIKNKHLSVEPSSILLPNQRPQVNL